jgi:hypothetical protein
VKPLAGAIVVALIVSAGWAGICEADPGQKPAASSDDVADQFKRGMQQIGDGARHVGEGIKQGAINAWEAVKAGAATAGQKLQQTGGAPKSGQPGASPGDASR